jgi:hypothetical protein
MAKRRSLGAKREESGSEGYTERTELAQRMERLAGFSSIKAG